MPANAGIQLPLTRAERSFFRSAEIMSGSGLPPQSALPRRRSRSILNGN
jgi:hypothetical protein